MLHGDRRGRGLHPQVKSTVRDQPTEPQKCRMGKPDDQETSVPRHGGVGGWAELRCLALKELSAHLSGFSSEQRTPEPYKYILSAPQNHPRGSETT